MAPQQLKEPEPAKKKAAPPTPASTQAEAGGLTEAEAVFKNGVLKISLPKVPGTEKKKGKKIKIKS